LRGTIGKTFLKKNYLINLYRALLTLTLKDIVIVVPEGNPEDHTRKAEYYNTTFEYLKELGIKVL
jgi:hypothetical protein